MPTQTDKQTAFWSAYFNSSTNRAINQLNTYLQYYLLDRDCLDRDRDLRDECFDADLSEYDLRDRDLDLDLNNQLSSLSVEK